MSYFLSALVLATSLQSPSWILDGRITAAEKSGTLAVPMSRGGTAFVRLEGGYLYAAVESPAGGFANVCIGSETKMRLLHASAALGDAEFELSGKSWKRLSAFAWALRDSPRLPAPAEADRKAHLDSRGWLATAKNAATTVREFIVRVRADERFVAFSFVETDGGGAVSVGPAAVSDGCADLRIAQGFLPEEASFAPATWLRIDQAEAKARREFRLDGTSPTPARIRRRANRPTRPPSVTITTASAGV